MHWLPPAPLLAAFCVASFVLAVTPGPGVIYIVMRTMAQGRRAGLASVAGVALGNLGNAWGAALGLAVLFAVSSLAFTVVKYAGAAYLLYLGIRMWRSGDANTSRESIHSTMSTAKIFRDGFVVALLNPKTALFFAAFLPQFMGGPASALSQSVALGALFVAIAATSDAAYALAASVVGPALKRAGGGWTGASGRRLSASAFIGLALFSVFASARRPG